jgi:predicted xylose isomerase-like sugar epimerase
MKMSCVDPVARMREMRVTHIVLVGKPAEVDHLGHVTSRLEDKNNVGPYSFQIHPLN